MLKKLIALLFAFLLIGAGISVHAQQKETKRIVSERLIVKVDIFSVIPRSLKVSPDSKRVAYVGRKGDKLFVVVNGEEGKGYDDIGFGSLIFSPDSKRVAYEAREGNKWFVVVDGEEGKRYDGIGVDTLIFSPDSKRVAYMAREGKNGLWL